MTLCNKNNLILCHNDSYKTLFMLSLMVVGGCTLAFISLGLLPYVCANPDVTPPTGNQTSASPRTPSPTQANGKPVNCLSVFGVVGIAFAATVLELTVLVTLGILIDKFCVVDRESQQETRRILTPL